jgi:hypothetical protein
MPFQFRAPHKQVKGPLIVANGGTGGSSPATVRANLGLRTILTADTTYYVRTGGSDTTGDGSTNTDDKAFATPQGAYDWLEANVDGGGYLIKIAMAAGTYTASSHRRNTVETGSETNVVMINANIPGAAAVIFEGDQTTPTNVIWNAAGQMCIWIAGGDGIFRFEGIAFRDLSVGASSRGMFCQASGANISFDDVDWGTFGTSHMHIYGPNILKLFGDYTISGGANRHIWLEGGCAAADLETHTVTLTGTPAFGTEATSGAFIMVEKNSSLFDLDVTYTGSATGRRFWISDFATIDTADTNEIDLNGYYPGDVNGVVIHRATGSRRTSTAVDGNTASANLQYQAMARDATAGALYSRYSNDAYGPHISLLKGRGTSIGDTTAPSSGDELGILQFLQADTSGNSPAAGVRALCASTAAFNDAPGHLELGTTADGAGSITWRWRVDLTGHLQPLVNATYDIGTSAPLGIRGLYFGGVAFASVPTAAAGAVTYITDSNTATWGATVAGGGANKVLAWYNGTNWTVIGA